MVEISKEQFTYNPGVKPPNPFLVAQSAHIAWGIAITFGAVVLGYHWYLGAIAILLIALIKELTYDEFIEEQPFLWSGAVDWTFYWVGVVIAVIILAIF